MLPLALGVGAALGIGGSLLSARAARKAATAQQDASYTYREISMPTAQELDLNAKRIENFQSQLNFSNAQLASLGNLLAQISPVLAQGFQSQLTGQGDITRQIEVERQQNLNRQIASMGTGASSSSAGMLADAMFGYQAGKARMEQSQMQSQINAQNASVFQALSGLGGQMASQTEGIGSSIGQSLANIQLRQLEGQKGIIQHAGANQVGNLMFGQGIQGLGNTIIGSVLGGASAGLAGK